MPTNYLTKSGLLYFSTLVAQALGLKADQEQVTQDIATALASAQSFTNSAIAAMPGIFDGSSISYGDMAENKVYWKENAVCFKQQINAQHYNVVKIKKDGIYIDEVVNGRSQEIRMTAWTDEVIAKDLNITNNKTPEEIRDYTEPGYKFISWYGSELYVGMHEASGKLSLSIYGNDKIVHKVAEANDTQWTVVDNLDLAVDSALSNSSTHPVQNKVVTAALALKAPLASPALTGTPTAPTPPAGTNSTRIATTAFVQSLISALQSNMPVFMEDIESASPDDFRGLLQSEEVKMFFDGHSFAIVYRDEANTVEKTWYLNGSIIYELATDGNDEWGESHSMDIGVDEQLDDSSTRAVQNCVVKAALDLKAPLASPALTGSPTAPTAAAGTNTTQLATTAFVQQAISAAIAGRFKYVASLPQTGEVGFIYLVPHTHTAGSTNAKPDLKDEYVWDSANSKWELIGNTDIDLSNYWNKDDLVAMTNQEILTTWQSAIDEA